jgi:hypothetical protein
MLLQTGGPAVGIRFRVSTESVLRLWRYAGRLLRDVDMGALMDMDSCDIDQLIDEVNKDAYRELFTQVVKLSSSRR